ncbi:MAG: L-threonylcarbamoyladenylate synthase [Betaproteobacteria bacterium]
MALNDSIALPDVATVARAAAMLRAGELVAFPTETVYGLGADARNDAALRAVFAAKGRPADHPVIVHLATTAQMDAWTRDVPPAARALAAAFWPGPLTLIVPRAAHVADVLTGGQDRVGLRVPSHPVAQQLLQAFRAAGGDGIAAPSANRFGRISPTTAAHVADDLGADVAMILDGGACPVGIESTIIAFDGDAPMLLRPGGLAAADIARVLGFTPHAPNAGAPRASGTLASHYAPRTPSRLVAPGDIASECARVDVNAAVLAQMVEKPRGFAGCWISAPKDAAGYAHDLYSNLRLLDAAGASAILIENVPDNAAWLAIRDRITRAAHGEDDDRD